MVGVLLVLMVSHAQAYEHKGPESLMGTVTRPPATDYLSQVRTVLTAVRGRLVTKPDVLALLGTFGSFAGAACAPHDELLLLPGFGPKKATRFAAFMDMPFRKDAVK